jgi:TRAP-type mannitol/chloroaromatic compound transport system permease large subunit
MEQPSRRTIFIARIFAGFLAIMVGSIALPLCFELLTKHEQVFDCVLSYPCIHKDIPKLLETASLTILLAIFCVLICVYTEFMELCILTIKLYFERRKKLK